MSELGSYEEPNVESVPHAYELSYESGSEWGL